MLLDILKKRFAEALITLVPDPTEWLEQIRPAQNATFGDYQANMAMPLAKVLGESPRSIAAKLVEKLQVDDILDPPEIAGPGFINLRFRTDWLAQPLLTALADSRLGVPQVAHPLKIIVDYSSPNLAKPMHVGHIRSTMIGNSICRTLRFLGHQVIADNHVGDWGTQFGMIIFGYKNFLDEQNWSKSPVTELGRLYRLVRQLTEENPDIGTAVLLETSKLHHGDPTNRQLWEMFLPYCQEDIERIYQRLNVSFDTTYGESFYNDRFPSLVEKLLEKNIARESDGAICVFLEGEEVPMLIRKKDGAYLYATSDLATIEFREETWHPDRILYVVDFRQSHHFNQLFTLVNQIGATQAKLVHVKFGTVLGEDGRPFKTRSGETVGLDSLLDEAYTRAYTIICDNDNAKKEGPQLTTEERQQTAERVGIGAIVYADLSQNRESDYVFHYDRMLAMNGNTATYLQYAYARIRSIFTKGGIDLNELEQRAIATEQTAVPFCLELPAERALALVLLRFTEAIEGAAKDYRPNILTTYLYDLANCYSSFFEQCPVLRAENVQVRNSRLLLCTLTAKTLQKGLELLGINTVERM